MIDPNQTVRIKYTNDYGILTRVSGGIVPRIGETVAITTEDETDVPSHDWYEVNDVVWKVQDSPERKPDVVEVKLVDIENDSDPENEPILDGQQVSKGARRDS